jgi:hypothetical protein
VRLLIGWLACDGKGDDAPPAPPIVDPGPTVAVQVEVDGAVVLEGLADGPENGLYQPSADGDCVPSRRVGLFKGADVYLEVLFGGEVPVLGSQVVFPSAIDEPSDDWDVASWRDEDELLWAAYGGVATLGAFGPEGAEVTLDDTTVCGSDRLGVLDADALWRDHTTDCRTGSTVVFRTLEPPPFDVTWQTWCATGVSGSWVTPEGETLCSLQRFPCPVAGE